MAGSWPRQATRVRRKAACSLASIVSPYFLFIRTTLKATRHRLCSGCHSAQSLFCFSCLFICGLVSSIRAGLCVNSFFWFMSHAHAPLSWASDNATIGSGVPLFQDSRSVAAFKGSKGGLQRQGHQEDRLGPVGKGNPHPFSFSVIGQREDEPKKKRPALDESRTGLLSGYRSRRSPCYLRSTTVQECARQPLARSLCRKRALVKLFFGQSLKKISENTKIFRDSTTSTLTTHSASMPSEAVNRNPVVRRNLHLGILAHARGYARGRA